MAATVLAAGVRSDAIAAIKSDAEIDHTLPEGTNAALTGPLGGGTAPTVVYRDELSTDPDALDDALASSLDDASSDADSGENRQPVASISCMVYCGLCAIALADGVPFDEVFFCSVCLTCAVDVYLSSTQRPPLVGSLNLTAVFSSSLLVKFSPDHD
jgi:hypothetical protein